MGKCGFHSSPLIEVKKLCDIVLTKSIKFDILVMQL